MQDVDRVADVEAFPQPAWARRLRVQVKSGSFVPRAECSHGIVRNCRRRWDSGEYPSIGSAELQLAVGLSLHLVSLLVDGAVMATAEHREI